MKTSESPDPARVLMCPPSFYGIEYEINPWMNKERGADHGLAIAQWNALREKLESLGCLVELLAPRPKLPDLVFTANAGLVAGARFIRSNFRHRERQGEQRVFDAWFAERNFEVVHLPSDLLFEGEGDALFCGDLLFCGYHFRSDIQSHRRLGELLGCLVLSLELIDERFYHLDTCLCPLPHGGALWFPGAFDRYAQRVVRDRIKLLADVPAEEAARFACNAIPLGRDILLPDGCPWTMKQLTALGLTCHPLPMTEFIKAGGACKCLLLFLDRPRPGGAAAVTV